MRGLVVLLICIFTLPVLFGMIGVWMVAPVTELVTIPISIYYIIRNDSTTKQRFEAETSVTSR
jgi:Na+-driven multidrug efflux pump